MYVPFSVSCVVFVCKCVLLLPGVSTIAVKYVAYHHTYIISYYYCLPHHPASRFNTREFPGSR
jgi:hypothetical protein